jgi:hypothetical protein
LKNILITDVTHTYILHSLFAALRQNCTRKISYGCSFIFAPKAQKLMNIQGDFSEHDFDAKRQRMSVKFSCA